MTIDSSAVSLSSGATMSLTATTTLDLTATTIMTLTGTTYITFANSPTKGFYTGGYLSGSSLTSTTISQNYFAGVYTFTGGASNVAAGGTSTLTLSNTLIASGASKATTSVILASIHTNCATGYLVIDSVSVSGAGSGSIVVRNVGASACTGTKYAIAYVVISP
ncbi:unnamed protein product [Heterosigma akashiwo]